MQAGVQQCDCAEDQALSIWKKRCKESKYQMMKRKKDWVKIIKDEKQYVTERELPLREEWLIFFH